MSRTYWTDAESARATALKKQGKSDEEIGRLLQRTPAAVATRLHKLRGDAGDRQPRGRASRSKTTNPAAIAAFLRKPTPCR